MVFSASKLWSNLLVAMEEKNACTFKENITPGSGGGRSELKDGKEQDFQVTFEASVRPSKFINKGSPGSFSGSTSNCRLVRHPPGCTLSRVPLLSLPSPPSPHRQSHTCQSASGLPLPLMSVKCQDLTASIRDCHKGLPESPTRLHPAWYHQTNCSASTTSSR